jgi:hypothetical protein
MYNVRGASKMKLKNVNKKRTVTGTVRRVIYFGIFHRLQSFVLLKTTV